VTHAPVTDAPTSDQVAVRASRIWTLSVGGETVDVEVTAHDHDRLSDVLPPLGAALGGPVTGLWAASSRLTDGLPLTAPELAHGAVLGLGGPVAASDRRSRSSALELRVVGGPDAGRSVALGQGHHVLGRGSGVSVRLDDPDVSRRHVAVHVGGGSITVADLGSTNGSRLDEVELDAHPRNWPAGAILRLGASSVTVTGPGGAAAALEAGPAGRLRLRPTPRMSTPAPEVEISFPRPPAAPPRRRLAWVAVALPAVGGVLMAWLLHTPTFLFFALLSPVVALGTWLSERWSGHRNGRRDAATHALEVLAAEARLADAVAADVRATEAAHPDLAALVAAARRRTHLLWSRARGDTDALTIRVGCGPGTTRVTRVQAEGSRARVPGAHLPVTVDLRAGGGLAVVGPRERTLGVLATVVAQLTALHAPGEVELLLLTDATRLRDWEWTRWLPHLEPGAVHVRATGAPGQGNDEDLNAWLTLLTARRRAVSGPRGGEPGPASACGWLVVVVDRSLDPRTTATLRTARDAGVLTVAAADSVEDVPVPVDTVLRLAGETGDLAVLSRQGFADRPDVRVDRLPRGTAAEFARDLAGLAPVSSRSTLPRRVRLLDLPSNGLTVDASGRISGSWSTARDRLVATLGRTAQGPLQVDLCREGPHALVAGTTGSGKSELLQTLIAGLALQHPPDRCSFLLVDYKGGAAFAEAATLPHTVGLVTDLDGQTTARALRSLGAELTRREQVLTAHDAADIAALPDDVALARLVIVVDEFATLAEELPTFVPGLIAIAQRGRSLGVHLVLATQRPSGVVSPEIRANCTLRICLRTTDEADSRDVLGTTDAAHLPVDVPGRAFLRSGSGAPTPLQVARVAGAADSRLGTGPEARVRVWPGGTHPTAERTPPVDASDLTRLCRAVTTHAEEVGRPAPHRPWRPPLPDHVPAAGLEEFLDGGPRGAHGNRARLAIGLIDRPDIQSRELLELDVEEGGTWLAVGGPRSGRTTLLRTVLGEAVQRFGPDELHVHVIESGGGSMAAAAAALPHAGTTVRGEDALRTVRLVDRLGREVAARRAGTTPGRYPLILLLVDGVEALSTLLDDADPARGSAALLRLMRDGAAVGLTCVATADRAVPGGRLAAAARQRLVLPLPDRADYAVAGIAARSVPELRTPGRALLGEEALECQLVLPRPLRATEPSSHPFPPPVRIVELPADPVLALASPETTTEQSGNRGVLSLPVGPGGDEGDPLVVDLLRTGGLLVSGPAGSGRSTALDAFVQHMCSVGAAVLRIGVPPGGRRRSGDEPELPWLDPGDEAGARAWVAQLAGRPGVVVADDVGTPAECAALDAIPAVGTRTGVALIAAASPGQLSGHYQGPVAALRRGRTGLLLCPGPGDADLLGVRLPRTPLPVRPGSGWLVTGAVMERVQVARRQPPAADQSSSSAGPISCVAYQASS
jgi:S-DNA-T family DNA segregation ATPase FtsK/SpoIIIE